jgi:hypothetical protein
MSVFLEQEALVRHLAPADSLQGHPGFGLATLSAGDVRGFKQIVNRDPIIGAPLPNPCDPAHAVVIGPKAKDERRGMARASQLLIAPG